MNLYERFMAGTSFRGFIDAAEANKALWADQARLATVPADAVARVRRLGRRFSLLVLNEDWCGDAVNSVPFVARLADEAGMDLRILGRDANPDLMDLHLSGTARAIPVVIVLDEQFEELGWWGSRPAPLQRWVTETGMTLPPEERYREVRRWYARDRGATTIEELVSLLERVAARDGVVTGPAHDGSSAMAGSR